MATIIQIRRRLTGADPITGQLQEGEFGYAYASGKLFVGGPSAGSVLEVGGEFFTNLLSATAGTATADKAVILDSSAEIDTWGVAGLVTAETYKTSLPVVSGFVKNDASGNLLFGQTGEQSDLDLTDLADVTITTPASGEFLKFNGSEWVNDVIVFPVGVTILDNLLDVDTTTIAPVPGDVLTFTGPFWTPLAPVAGGVTQLDNLTDVDTSTTSPVTGDHLEFNGTLWVPAAPGHTAPGAAALDDLSDVTITSVSSGDFLRFDGSVFVNTTISLGDLPSSLVTETGTQTLTNKTLTTPIIDQINVSAGTFTLNSAITNVSSFFATGITSGGYAVSPAPAAGFVKTDLGGLFVFGSTIGLGDLPAIALDDLSDVSVAAASINQLLEFDGSVWIPTSNIVAASLTVSGTVTSVDFRSTKATATTPGFVKNSGTGTLLYGQPVVLSLNDLTGVFVPSPVDGDVLTFNFSNLRWEAQAPAGLTQSIDDHVDVNVPSPSTGQVLEFGGSLWEGTQSPRLVAILASDSRQIVGFIDTFAGVGTDLSFVEISSGEAVDGPVIRPASAVSANVDLVFHTKGTGRFRLRPGGLNPAQGFVKNDAQGELLLGQAPGISLDDLDSVFVPSPSNNDVLTFISANNRWEAVAATGGGPIALNNLTDVTLTSPSTGEVLTFTGTVWENQPAAPAGLHAVTHVSGGTDVIDGDTLDITFVPAAYTPTPAPTFSTVPVELASHLFGIDLALGALTAPITTFLGLTDTPSTFSGSAGLFVRVNAGATALEFVAGGGATDLDSLTDVTITSPATGSVLVKSAGDWVNSQAPTLIAIDQPSGQKIIGFVSTTGTNFLDVETVAGGMVLQANDPGGNSDLVFRTSGTGIFAFQPGGGTPASGLIKTGGGGIISFGQSVTDAEVPDILTLTTIKGLTDIELPAGTDILTFVRQSGTSRFEIIAQTDAMNLVATGSTDASLIFVTVGAGTFKFFDGFTAAATGLMKIGGSGTLLFGQSLLLSDLPAIDLDDLADVAVAAPNDGDVLTFNNTSGDWEAVAPTTGGATDLDSLTDVTITFPATDALLQFDGSQWIDQVNLVLDSTAAAHWGGINVNDTWRIIRTGNDLAFERRESTVYVEKAKFTAASFFTSGSITASGTITGANFVGIQLADLPSLAETIALTELSDVSIVAVATGDFLRKSSSDWVNTTIADGDVPETLTLGQIDTPTGTAIMRFSRSIGTHNLLVSSAGAGMTLTSTKNFNFHTAAASSGTFSFHPETVAAATGLMKIGGTGVILFGESLVDADVPNTLTLDAIEQPTSTSIMTFTRTSGTGSLEVEADSTSTVRLIATAELDFQTTSGDFFFKPSLTAAAPGLMKIDTSFGRVLFGQSLVDADIPTSLTLLSIEQPDGTNIMTFTRTSGTGSLEVEADSSSTVRLIASTSLDFQTTAGDFFFKPSLTAAAPGLMKIDTSFGRVLFGQTLADADVPDILTLTRINDANGNEVLDFFGNASAINNVRIINRAAGLPPAVVSVGDDADVGLRFDTKGNGEFFFFPGGSVAASSGLMRIGSSGEIQFNTSLTDADVPNILTLTRIDGLTRIDDASGNELLTFFANASAVNNILIANRATGAPPAVLVAGNDADIGLEFQTKGTGDFFFFPGAVAASTGLMRIGASGVLEFATSLTDADVPEILTLTSILGTTSGVSVLTLADVASAVNRVSIGNSAIGGPLEIKAIGSDTDIDLTLHAKGTAGAVKVAPGFDFAVDGGDAKFADSVILTDPGTDPKAYYWGDPTTDGSWRLIVIAGTLTAQKLITGTWTDTDISPMT